MTAKLAVTRLSKSFGDLEALRGINLNVERGEFISVVGPSGCGKTTFLRIVAGLEHASSGEVLLDGRAVREPGSDRGFVFQNDSLLPWRTVLANAIIGREVAGSIGPADRKRTMELLKLVGLEGFEHYHPRQLSGGMRQRVNLARALAIDPEILLMDEPFAALDAQTREIMQTELLRIWERGQKTVLFVTHQIDEAVFLSDRVLVFARRPGRVQAEIKIRAAAPAPIGHQAHAGIRRARRPHLADDRGRRTGGRALRECVKTAIFLQRPPSDRRKSIARTSLDGAAPAPARAATSAFCVYIWPLIH